MQKRNAVAVIAIIMLSLLLSLGIGAVEYPDGSKARLPGELIQPSYINFVFANGAVIVPTFDDPMDDEVPGIFKKAFPDREIISFPAREVVLGGGGLHCITKNY